MTTTTTTSTTVPGRTVATTEGMSKDIAKIAQKAIDRLLQKPAYVALANAARRNDVLPFARPDLFDLPPDHYVAYAKAIGAEEDYAAMERELVDTAPRQREFADRYHKWHQYVEGYIECFEKGARWHDIDLGKPVAAREVGFFDGLLAFLHTRSRAGSPKVLRFLETADYDRAWEYLRGFGTMYFQPRTIVSERTPVWTFEASGAYDAGVVAGITANGGELEADETNVSVASARPNENYTCVAGDDPVFVGYDGIQARAYKIGRGIATNQKQRITRRGDDSRLTVLEKVYVADHPDEFWQGWKDGGGHDERASLDVALEISSWTPRGSESTGPIPSTPSRGQLDVTHISPVPYRTEDEPMPSTPATPTTPTLPTSPTITTITTTTTVAADVPQPDIEFEKEERAEKPEKVPMTPIPKKYVTSLPTTPAYTPLAKTKHAPTLETGDPFRMFVDSRLMASRLFRDEMVESYGDVDKRTLPVSRKIEIVREYTRRATAHLACDERLELGEVWKVDVERPSKQNYDALRNCEPRGVVQKTWGNVDPIASKPQTEKTRFGANFDGYFDEVWQRLRESNDDRTADHFARSLAMRLRGRAMSGVDATQTEQKFVVFPSTATCGKDVWIVDGLSFHEMLRAKQQPQMTLMDQPRNDDEFGKFPTTFDWVHVKMYHAKQKRHMIGPNQFAWIAAQVPSSTPHYTVVTHSLAHLPNGVPSNMKLYENKARSGYAPRGIPWVQRQGARIEFDMFDLLDYLHDLAVEIGGMTGFQANAMLQKAFASRPPTDIRRKAAKRFVDGWEYLTALFFGHECGRRTETKQWSDMTGPVASTLLCGCAVAKLLSAIVEEPEAESAKCTCVSSGTGPVATAPGQHSSPVDDCLLEFAAAIKTYEATSAAIKRLVTEFTDNYRSFLHGRESVIGSFLLAVDPQTRSYLPLVGKKDRTATEEEEADFDELEREQTLALDRAQTSPAEDPRDPDPFEYQLEDPRNTPSVTGTPLTPPPRRALSAVKRVRYVEGDPSLSEASEDERESGARGPLARRRRRGFRAVSVLRQLRKRRAGAVASSVTATRSVRVSTGLAIPSCARHTTAVCKKTDNVFPCSFFFLSMVPSKQKKNQNKT